MVLVFEPSDALQIPARVDGRAALAWLSLEAGACAGACDGEVPGLSLVPLWGAAAGEPVSAELEQPVSIKPTTMKAGTVILEAVTILRMLTRQY
jgi:hypothetical protein